MLERKLIDPERIPAAVIAKWDGRVLSEGFTPVPKRLLRCLGRFFQGKRGTEQLAVILSVVDYKRPNLIRPPSLEYLAFIAGLSAADFRLRLSEMEKKGWITVTGTDAELDVGIEPLMNEIMKATEGD